MPRWCFFPECQGKEVEEEVNRNNPLSMWIFDVDSGAGRLEDWAETGTRQEERMELAMFKIRTCTLACEVGHDDTVRGRWYLVQGAARFGVPPCNSIVSPRDECTRLGFQCRGRGWPYRGASPSEVGWFGGESAREERRRRGRKTNAAETGWLWCWSGGVGLVGKPNRVWLRQVCVVGGWEDQGSVRWDAS